MSIRIHELAKRHNMEGKDMLALLKQRGYVSADTKSVSSTVSKIYEEEIDKEFAAKAAPKPVEPKPAAPVAEPVHEAPKLKMPAGVFVKSAQDIAREKEARAAALKPAPMAPPLPPRSAPLAPPPARPAVVAPVSTPAPRPPVPAAAPAPRPVAPPPVHVPAPVAKAPVAPPPLPPRSVPLPPPPIPGTSSPIPLPPVEFRHRVGATGFGAARSNA